MLPQPDPHILDSNPLFAALYKDLETTKLEANGRGRVGLGAGVVDKVAFKEKGEFEDRLYKARVEEAKKEILRDTLGVVGNRDDGSLSDELLQTIQITTAQLSGIISPQDRSIADAENSHFLSEIQIITPFLSTHLIKTSTLLTRLANPSSPTESNPTNFNLSTTLSTLQTKTTTSRANLSVSRAAVAKQSAELLLLYTTLQESIIKLLEQVLHGSISRHVRAQSSYLALVAQGIEKKMQILRKQVSGQVYTADVRMKLQRELEDVEGEIRVCRGRLGRREGVLGQLEQVGRGLEKCAEDCKALRGEIGKTREELERLEGA